jgi:DNA-binding CsgD family transcriptional regulator
MKKYDREPLTDRHKEVVRLISLGCTVQETAAILKLAPNTVDNHKAEAMRRLGTNKVALLTRIALQMRLTSMKDHLTPTEKRRSKRKNDGWN